MRAPRSRHLGVGLAALALAATSVLAVAPADAARPAPRQAAERVHWAHGKALAAQSGKGYAATVRAYLAGHGGGTGAAGLRESGSWTSHGTTYLRMEQYVGGLRVADSYAKAAFDKQGRLIAVLDNTVAASTPAASRVSKGQAIRAAVSHLYAGTPRWTEPPSAEKVAETTTAGLAQAWVVTTWDSRNQLRDTLVSGDGAVVRSDLRTAEDGYNIYPEDPSKSGQTLVGDPADPAASPNGWLSGSQWSNNITGNNAHAYLDKDANNKPDANDTPVGNGVFGAVANLAVGPDAADNTDVAVQNLFYLNNLIHDTLYKAGFTEAAGNFQTDNFGKGGKGGDPVAAEAQDGSGTDNANFATPGDGKDPRMQMYLWNSPVTHEVIQAGTSYGAAGAAFGASLNATGLTGPLVVADDSAGTTSDACEALPSVAAGSLVIADRGTCAFTVKAKNAQQAGAAGIIVANNAGDSTFAMGGTDSTVTIPAVIVGQTSGAVLKAGAGSATTMRLKDPAPLMLDGDLDSDIVWHEYGHGLTWRMIGRMSGTQAGSIGEGMSDVLSVIVNDDPVVGEYAFGDAGGIRSHSYEGYPNTYGTLPGSEVHDGGEIYGAIGWDLWKQYKGASLGQSDILADLVAGMNFTPASPTFEQMRDGILMGLTASGHDARACWVWNSFAKYGVGVGATGTDRKVTESFTKPTQCA